MNRTDWRSASALPAGDLARIELALSWRPTAFRPAAADRGASDTGARWIVADTTGDSARRRTAFVKIGATPLTAEWFRTEHRNYRALEGWYLPQVLGFEDGDRPVLVLEDLSHADWPPPWTDGRIGAVLEALQAIRETDPPDHLPRLDLDQGADWRSVADNARPFLSLGLCSAAWLDGALPVLEAAATGAPLAGDALVHGDIRSDNLCFRDGRAIVIDWNHATVANPDFDVAAWLPSLHAEGGPPPEAILPHALGLAAWVAGFFCARAGGPPIPEAPHVRPLQVSQARTALPWAARALGLPPP